MGPTCQRGFEVLGLSACLGSFGQLHVRCESAVLHPPKLKFRHGFVGSELPLMCCSHGQKEAHKQMGHVSLMREGVQAVDI